MAFELERTQQQVRKLEGRMQVRDSFGMNPYPWFGQLISPIAAYYDGIVPIAAPAPMIWDTTLGLGVYFTEVLLDIIRAYARWFVASTPQAHGVVDSLTDYVIGTGFDYEVQEKRSERVAKDNLQRAQKIIDSFLSKNEWFETEVDAYKRTHTDGEWAPRLYAQGDGVTELRTMEPWQIRGADTTPQHLFGLVSPEGDTDKIEGYNVTFNGVLSEAEFVPVEQMSLLKRNTPKRARRGVTDFLCLQGTFQQTMALLNNSLQGESARQSLLWIQETNGAANPLVQMNSQGTTIDGPGCTLGDPGRFEGPRVATVDKNLQFKPGPVGDSVAATAILLEGYRALASFFRVPVWMLAGMGGGSFAGNLVENDPLGVMVKREKKNFTEPVWCAPDQGPPDCRGARRAAGRHRGQGRHRRQLAAAGDRPRQAGGDAAAQDAQRRWRHFGPPPDRTRGGRLRRRAGADQDREGRRHRASGSRRGESTHRGSVDVAGGDRPAIGDASAQQRWRRERRLRRKQTPAR